MVTTFLFDTVNVLLVILLCVSQALVINVEPENGTEDPNCRTGGNYLLCKSYHNDIPEHIQLKSSSITSLNCQKDLLSTLQKALRTSYKHGYYIGEVLTCIDNAISVQDCNCVTYDNNILLCGILLGPCPYGCSFTTDNSNWGVQLHHPLPKNFSELNYVMCGRLDRDGPMCSKCRKGFSPLVYSYDLKCIHCTDSHHNWLKFIAVAFIPLTIFYFVVILFQIDATSPYLYGFITLNQALGSPINLREILLALKAKNLLGGRLLAIPYTIWNLDFFRSLTLNICLDLTTLQTLALDYAIAVYPLVLVVITYTVIELHARGCRVLVWLWRPFHRCCVRFTRIMDIQSSIIKAFATFLLLSYVKLLNATSDILLPVKLYHINSKVDGYGWYVYYDASYQCFSKDHLPYAIMSIAFFIVFGLSPLILLLLYPMSCFQRHCYGANNHALHTFVDAFQGHYKDGTEPGTRDCRWFAAIYFLGRIIILYIIVGAIKSAICYTLSGLSLMAIGMLIILLQPFKSTKVNTYHTILPFLIAIGCLFISLLNEAVSKARWMIRTVVVGVVIFYMSPILALIVYAAFRCYRKCRRIRLEHYQRNLELDQENLMRGNRENYRAIN